MTPTADAGPKIKGAFMIVPNAWYPVAAWDRFLDAMRAEAAARRVRYVDASPRS